MREERDAAPPARPRCGTGTRTSPLGVHSAGVSLTRYTRTASVIAQLSPSPPWASGRPRIQTGWTAPIDRERSAGRWEDAGSASRRKRSPGRQTASPSSPSGVSTPSQSSIAGNRSTVRTGSAGSGSLDHTGVCMCDRTRLPCPARCSGHLEPLTEVVALARDHDAGPPSAAGPELVQQMVRGVGVGASQVVSSHSLPGRVRGPPQPSGSPVERPVADPAARAPSRAAPSASLTHTPPSASSAATSPTAGSRSSAGDEVRRRPRTRPVAAGARSATGASRGSPGRAYTIAEPLPATITAARGSRSQSTGCDRVGTPARPEPLGQIEVRVHRGRPVVAHHEIRACARARPAREARAHLADGRVHLPERAPHRLGVGIGLVGVAVHGGELGEDEPRRPVDRGQQVAGHRVVRRLVPLGIVRQRAPELPLAARGIALGRESPRDRREDADALRHQLEDGPHLAGDVAVEPRRLVAAVAPHRLALAPPAPVVGAPVEPADRGDVAVPGRAAGEERQVGDAGGGREDGDGAGPSARPPASPRAAAARRPRAAASATSGRRPSTRSRRQRVGGGIDMPQANRAPG